MEELTFNSLKELKNYLSEMKGGTLLKVTVEMEESRKDGRK